MNSTLRFSSKFIITLLILPFCFYAICKNGFNCIGIGEELEGTRVSIVNSTEIGFESIVICEDNGIDQAKILTEIGSLGPFDETEFFLIEPEHVVSWPIGDTAILTPAEYNQLITDYPDSAPMLDSISFDNAQGNKEINIFQLEKIRFDENFDLEVYQTVLSHIYSVNEDGAAELFPVKIYIEFGDKNTKTNLNRTTTTTDTTSTITTDTTCPYAAENIHLYFPPHIRNLETDITTQTQTTNANGETFNTMLGYIPTNAYLDISGDTNVTTIDRRLYFRNNELNQFEVDEFPLHIQAILNE
jgi:hypothetical protein